MLVSSKPADKTAVSLFENNLLLLTAIKKRIKEMSIFAPVKLITRAILIGAALNTCVFASTISDLTSKQIKIISSAKYIEKEELDKYKVCAS